MKEELSVRLKKAMEIRGMRQVDLCSKTGIYKSKMSMYVNGTYEPKHDAIFLIAKALNVQEAWLMGYDVPMEPGEQSVPELDDSVTVNVLGRVAAGCPMLAQEDIIGQIRCSVDQKRGCELFALKIKGDSMEPRIYDGDIVVVRRQDDAVSGDVVIALVDECEDAVCKRYMTYGDTPMLVSLNPKYAPILGKDIKVLGKVIEVRSML